MKGMNKKEGEGEEQESHFPIHRRHFPVNSRQSVSLINLNLHLLISIMNYSILCVRSHAVLHLYALCQRHDSCSYHSFSDLGTS